MSGQGNRSLLQEESVLTFIQYAARYCALMEPQTTPIWDIATLRECQRTLGHIYAAACDLPDLPISSFVTLERIVQEEDYERVRLRMERILGEEDRFLNVQMEEMKYSDRPVSVSSAELLADLYQVMADTTWIFRTQIERSMHQAIAEVKYTFQHDWGALLLAVLRQIHDLLVAPDFYLQEDIMTDEA